LSQPSTGLAVIALYILGQVWLWYCNTTYRQHWYPHLAVGLFMIVPLLLFAAVILVRSGARDLRRARLLIHKLHRRRDWPEDLSLCLTLPEVLALREAIQTAARPALALLGDARPEIRVAALGALAFRTTWQQGEAEFVQQVGQRAAEPAVRAAAIRALAFSRDPFVVETLAKSLRDLAPEVRRAAAEVLFWDSERRWGWVRYNVHEALADPELRNEGPLPLGGVMLPPQAVSDLNEWASEGGDTTIRATLTLVNYYGHILNARADGGGVAAELRQKILDPQAATMLRVELAQLLFEQQLLDRPLRESLLSPDQPVPLRLLGADALLLDGPSPTAVRTLRDVARKPNREIALAVAQIVQRRMNVDLGLNLQNPPERHNRAAAEVTHRVMEWAAEIPPEEATTQSPSERAANAAANRPDSDWDFTLLPPRRGTPPPKADS
jgi:hypothetical protein